MKSFYLSGPSLAMISAIIATPAVAGPPPATSGIFVDDVPSNKTLLNASGELLGGYHPPLSSSLFIDTASIRLAPTPILTVTGQVVGKDTALATADLQLYYEIIGPASISVPLIFSAEGRTETEFSAGASVLLGYDGKSVSACSGFRSCPGTSFFNIVDDAYSVQANIVYSITMDVVGQADSISYPGSAGSFFAELDPLLTIDPSFSIVDPGYSLELSPNLTASASPEPSTWLMLLMGMAGVGLMKSASFSRRREQIDMRTKLLGMVAVGLR